MLQLGLMVLDPSSARAQFDLGVHVGAFGSPASAGVEGHAYGACSTDPSWGGQFTTGFSYREQCPPRTNLGIEVWYTYRSVSAHYETQSMMQGEAYESVATLHLLHLGILPQIRLDRKGLTAVRFGLLVGGLLGGRESTTYRKWDGLENSEGEIDRAADYTYQGDVRVLLGLSIRIPLSAGTALSTPMLERGSRPLYKAISAE